MTSGLPPGDPLLRYREVVPDWEDFVRFHRSPEPVTLRVRTALRSVDQVRRALEDRGFTLSVVPGLPDYLRVDHGPYSVAQTLEHWVGHFHVQQAVMAIPSLALAPRAGERVLDLCAAPGGKTAHLAELMTEEGCLVAVDPKEKRLRGLMSNLFRLGLPNVVVVAADGRELPEGGRFDRVLVDAPCSAQGNYRRSGGRLPLRDRRFTRYVSSLQEALLRRAVACTRPGGRIVYSTCTYAPEENEAVVARVLRDSPAQLVDVDLGSASLPHEPGLSEWEGEAFGEGMERSWRVYPQHLDSGGAFLAVLERTDDASGIAAAQAPAEPTPPPSSGVGRDLHTRARPTEGWQRVPNAFPGEDPSGAGERIRRAVTDLEERYGVHPAADPGRPEGPVRSLAGDPGDGGHPVGWMVRGENIWLQTAGEWPVGGWEPSGAWRVVSVGIRAFRADSRGRETPSNAFLGRFAHHLGADRRRQLTRSELEHLLSGEPLEDETLPAGPLALLYDGWVIGRGMVGRGGLRHQIPSAQARRLKALLAGS